MADADKIRTVGIIGAGQMGRGIAQVAAQAGLEVVLLDATMVRSERLPRPDNCPSADRSVRCPACGQFNILIAILKLR